MKPFQFQIKYERTPSLQLIGTLPNRETYWNQDYDRPPFEPKHNQLSPGERVDKLKKIIKTELMIHSRIDLDFPGTL